MTDLELVARARAGDTAAFGELVNRHRAAVFRAALAALGSASEADDVAQDACVTAFRRLGTFREASSFRTWLLAIAWRHALTRRRGFSRWVQSLRGQIGGLDPGPDSLDAARWPVVSSSDPDPEAALLQREEMQAAARLIRALSPKLRDCLLLAGSGAYTYEEISAMVHAPVGTVKWRVSEARRVVKTRLRRAGFEHD